MDESIDPTLLVKIDGSQAITTANRLSDSLDDLERSGDKAADSVSQVGKGAERSSSGFGKLLAVGTLLSGALAAVGAASVFSQFTDSVTQTEKLRGSLQTMVGSAENAKIAFAGLTKFAAETPFTLDQSVQGFIRLKSLGLDPGERSLRSYGNTASAMGKDMMQMIEAVADASTGEFERLKEFGIKSRKEGDNIKFTFQGVTTQIGNSSKEIQEYLLKIGETKFGTAMADQMERLPGLFSNVEDSMDGLFRAVGDAGGIQFLSNVLKGLVGVLGSVTDSVPAIIEALKTFGLVAGVGSALYIGLAALPAVVGGITTAYYALISVISLSSAAAASSAGVWALLTTNLYGTGVAAQFAASGMGKLQVAAGVMFAAWAGWEIGKYLRENFLEARLAGLALVEGLLLSVEKLKYWWQDFGVTLIELWTKATNTIKILWADLLSSIAGAMSNIPLFQGAAQSLREYADEMRSGVVSADEFSAEHERLKASYDSSTAAIRENIGGLVDYEIEQDNANKMSGKSTKTLDDLAKATEETGAAAAGASKEYVKAQLSITQYIDSLKDKIKTIKMTERESEIFNAQLKLGATATKAQKDEVTALTGELYDLSHAFKGVAHELGVELAAIKLSARDQAIFRDQLKLTSSSTDEERKAVALLSGQLYDAQEASKAAADKTKELGTAMADTKNQVDPFTSALTGMIERIDSAFADAWKGAFDSFDSFKSGIIDGFKQMLAELAHLAITKPIIVSISSAMGLGGSSGALASVTGGGGGGLGSLGQIFNAGKSVLEWGKGVVSGFQSGGFSGGLDAITQPFLKGVGNLFGGVTDALGMTLAPVKDAFGNVIMERSMAGTVPIFDGAGNVTGYALGGNANWFQTANYNMAQLPGGALGGGLITAGAGIAGGYVGNKLGEALTDRTATQSYGQMAGGIGGAYIGAQAGMWGGPIGAAIGAGIGALIDIAFGTDDTKRQRLGVVAGTPSNSTGAGESVKAASGLSLQPIARRASQESADAMLDVFLMIDQALTGISADLGVVVDLTGKDLINPLFVGSKSAPSNFFGDSEDQKLRKDRIEAAPADFFRQWLNTVKGDFETALQPIIKKFINSTSDDVEMLINSFEQFSTLVQLHGTDAVSLGKEIYGNMKKETEGLVPALQTVLDTSTFITDTLAKLNPLSGDFAELNSALAANKSAIAELSAQYMALSDTITATFKDTRTQIEESLLNTEQIYERRRTQMDDLLGKLQAETDPGRIAALTDQINQLTLSAYGMLNDDQKQAKGQEFLQFLSDAEQVAQDSVVAGQNNLDLNQFAISTAVQKALDGAAEKQTIAADTMTVAAQTQQAAANIFAGAAVDFSTLPQDVQDAIANLPPMDFSFLNSLNFSNLGAFR